MSRLAAVLLPLALVLGLAPAPANAATVNTTHATFRGWVNAAKTGGATYDTYPWDEHRLTGDCKKVGTFGGGITCQVHWSLVAGTSYTVCTTGTAAGWVGHATYYQPGMPFGGVSGDLFAVGAPGAATFEAFVPLNATVLHMKIDAAAACAALKVVKADPYADSIPNGFSGTAQYLAY